MKVILVNGSSRENGCTNVALNEVKRALNEEGILTETIFIGNKAYPDCIACRKCKTTNECIFHDLANELADKAKEADGFVFGSPVYYAHPSARLLTIMDRVFIQVVKILCINQLPRFYQLEGQEQPPLLMSLTSILLFVLCL